MDPFPVGGLSANPPGRTSLTCTADWHSRLLPRGRQDSHRHSPGHRDHRGERVTTAARLGHLLIEIQGLRFVIIKLDDGSPKPVKLP